MSLRDHLQGIYETHKELTPGLVVEVARDESHPLHDRFEWNDSVAGEKYREVQAGDLIRSVRIRYTAPGSDQERDVRAFHAVPRADGHSYVPVEELVRDDVSRGILLRQMERDWKSFRRRYEHLDEFLKLIQGDIGPATAA